LFFLPSLACGAYYGSDSNQVRGSGKIVTKNVEVSDFDRVMLANTGDVYIEQGEMESLTIEADDNILPLLDTTVTGAKLVLDSKPNQNLDPSQAIVYRLTVKDLNGIELNGSGNFYVKTVQSKDMKISVNGSGDVEMKALDSDSLSINLNGSGNIRIEKIATKKIESDVMGSGDITLEGKADTQTVSVNGSGNYLAGDLETDSADIRVPGSADITVWVQDHLKIYMNGSGNVRYYGKPTVDQSGGGSGNISSLGEK